VTHGSEPLAGALREMEATMPRFAHWMYDTVRSGLGQRVVDAGAGIGAYTELLLADGREVVALEYLPAFAAEIERRFGDKPKVTVIQADLGDPDGLPEFPPGDSIICLNVLEHVEDDLQALRNIRERVKRGGRLFILVPAYAWLFNSMDRAVGHHRRYRKGELVSRLEAADWEVERVFRFNAFGVPGWFVGGLLKRQTAGKTLFRLYDRLTPAFAAIEKVAIRGLWGLSLVAVCRRAD